MEVGPSQKDLAKIPLIPDKTWGKLLHKTIIGNGLFPQSPFAQGILLAQGIAEDTSVASPSVILKQNPSDELLLGMFHPARIKAHKAYNIPGRTIKPILKNTWHSDESTAPPQLSSKWIQETPEDPQVNSTIKLVWRGDKSQAKIILNNIARFVYDERQGTNTEPFRATPQMLDETASDPLFQELVQTIAQTLTQEDVRNLSNEYKGLISAFTQKYKIESLDSYDINLYHEDSDVLQAKLHRLAQGVVPFIKENLVNSLQERHLNLQERIQTAHDEHIIGGIEIDTIDPLKIIGPSKYKIYVPPNEN